MKKTVICVSGKMRSGKNQFADYFAEILKEKNLNYEFNMFAGDLKANSYYDFNRMNNIFISEYKRLNEKYPDNEMLKELSWLDVKEKDFYDDKTLYTRPLLQIYGTDIFCKRVDKDYWAKQVLDKVIKSDKQFVLITDLRFPNEIDMMYSKHEEEYDLWLIRIDRNTGINNDHPSEVSLDDFNEWNYIVDNNGSLEDLKNASEVIFNEIINKDTLLYQNEATF